MKQDKSGDEFPESISHHPGSRNTLGDVKVLSILLLLTLFFTVLGIPAIDRYILKLDDFQVITLILVPWCLFIFSLTIAFTFRVLQGSIPPQIR